MKTGKLSPLQRQVLVGTLLGSAHLRLHTCSPKYRYVVLQSEDHKRYVYHLYDIFKDFTEEPPKLYCFKSKRFPGRSFVGWGFYTCFQSCFRFYAHQFYTLVADQQSGTLNDLKTRKTVPKLIHKWLTPCAIAYWYMDHHAGLCGLGVFFCNLSFTLPENYRLLLVLKPYYLLDSTCQKEGRGFKICISSLSSPQLRQINLLFLNKACLRLFGAPKKNSQI